MRHNMADDEDAAEVDDSSASSFDEEDHQQDNNDGGGSVVYLNNAHQARLDPSVQHIGVSYITKEPWEMNYFADVVADQQEVRRLYGKLIGGAQAKDIAIMPSTAFAVTLAAHNIFHHVVSRGEHCSTTCCCGRILVLQDQFDSAIYPWQEICRLSQGALTLDVVPYPSSNDETWTQAVMARLNNNNNNSKSCDGDDSCDDKILAVCLPPLHWSDGSLLDLKVIGQSCLEQDIPLIVDATQAVGIFPIDIHSIPGCCLLACSAHKWLRGPSGMSLVYIHERLHDTWQPLDQHGRGRVLPATEEASRPCMGPDGYPETFYADARKFDSGGKANPHLIPMLRASLQQVVQLAGGDLDQVQEELGALMQPLLDWAASHGGYIVPPRQHAANHLVGIRPTPEVSPKELMSMAKQLQEEWGIYIAPRCGGFRISPYIDNSKQDIDRLIQGLEEVMERNKSCF